MLCHPVVMRRVLAIEWANIIHPSATAFFCFALITTPSPNSNTRMTLTTSAAILALTVHDHHDARDSDAALE